jgi:nitroreductase
MGIQDIIRERYSVRIYRKEPIAEETRAALLARLNGLRTGPLGSSTRFELVAATEKERASLRGLGTYGFIKDASGFIIGAVEEADHALEDYGYMMEKAILEATALGLGTCWLGGSFTKSSFARKVSKRDHEIIPAVVATGYATPEGREKDIFRRGARSDRRQPWESLFFDGSFSTPLSSDEGVGGYAQALDMVRIAPSASNKQPWRVVRDGNRWHFYCQRTPGYGKGSWTFILLRLADLQRLDVGIAMCHFELTAGELGLNGAWRIADPGLVPVDEMTLYIATWEEGG